MLQRKWEQIPPRRDTTHIPASAWLIQKNNSQGATIIKKKKKPITVAKSERWNAYFYANDYSEVINLWHIVIAKPNFVLRIYYHTFMMLENVNKEITSAKPHIVSQFYKQIKPLRNAWACCYGLENTHFPCAAVSRD